MFEKLLLALFTAGAYAGLIAGRRARGESVIWNVEAAAAMGAGQELLRWWIKPPEKGGNGPTTKG